MSDKPKAPVHKITSGVLSLTIWERQHNEQMFYNCTVSRAYTQDGGKTWLYSDSFGRDDLPVIANLLNSAHLWIVGKLAAQ